MVRMECESRNMISFVANVDVHCKNMRNFNTSLYHPGTTKNRKQGDDQILYKEEVSKRQTLIKKETKGL